MFVNSASQSQYTYRAYPSAATQAADAAQQAQAAKAKTGAGDGASSSATLATGSLFSGGKFTGAAQLTSPETLAALFQLNADGSVAHGDYGGVLAKPGQPIESSQGRMAVALAIGPKETWSAADAASAKDLAKITDDDKAMFRQVTGYNLFISGPMVMVVDDEGNRPPEADRAATDELATRLQYARTSGQTVDADWFHGISKDISDWGGPKFPADWDQKADAWFDDVTKARREAKAAEAGVTSSSAADTQSAASKPVEHSKMQAATQAYSEAAKLAAPAAS